MATRSTISVVHGDESVSQVYCHFDGYLEHTGKLLFNFYNSIEKAEKLISMGGISYLGESDERPPQHTYSTPVEGYTVFYNRDRGEEIDIRKFRNLTDFVKNSSREEYNYLFKDGEWYYDNIELKKIINKGEQHG